jgi:hypothetical protein
MSVAAIELPEELREALGDRAPDLENFLQALESHGVLEQIQKELFHEMLLMRGIHEYGEARTGEWQERATRAIKVGASMFVVQEGAEEFVDLFGMADEDHSSHDHQQLAQVRDDGRY